MNTTDPIQTSIEPDAQPQADSGATKIQEAVRKTREKLEHAQEAGQSFIKEHPITTLVGVAAVGCLLGWLAVGRREPTWRERYIDDPADRLRGWMGSAVDRSSEALSDYRDRATDLAHTAGSAVRKGLARLRFW